MLRFPTFAPACGRRYGVAPPQRVSRKGGQRRRTLNTCGFTLIEMMVVILIVGSLLFLSATRLDFLVPKYRLRGAAREIGAAMKQAKAHAAATGKDVYLEYDLSKGEYWMLFAFPKRKEDGTEFEPRVFEYEPLFRRPLPTGVEFVDVICGDQARTTSGNARVKVSPFGISAHTIVNLKSKEDREIAVKLNGFTGYLTFYDRHTDADKLLEDTGP